MAKYSGQRKVNNFAIQLLFSIWHLFILDGPALQLYSALRGKYALQIPQANIAMLTSTSTSSFLALKDQPEGRRGTNTKAKISKSPCTWLQQMAKAILMYHYKK